MREIIFRGKSVEPFFEKEWRYGNLIIRKDLGVKMIIMDNVGYCNGIDPDTIGQYTGTNDKNGVKIFEGDIVKLVVGYQEPEKTNYGKFVITWYDYDGGFILSPETDEDEGAGYLNYGSDCYEVVGNIHDNPEMLEV
jgi:uncharacterized phage protein (TIGR01671 family)